VRAGSPWRGGDLPEVRFAAHGSTPPISDVLASRRELSTTVTHFPASSNWPVLPLTIEDPSRWDDSGRPSVGGLGATRRVILSLYGLNEHGDTIRPDTIYDF
jgi:hypothetical protein